MIVIYELSKVFEKKLLSQMTNIVINYKKKVIKIDDGTIRFDNVNVGL